MRIVIDGRMIGPRWTGIGLYGRKLLAELQTLDSKNRYLVLLDHERFESWRPSSPNFEAVLAPERVYGLAEQTTLASRIRRLQPDLVHFLHVNVPILYRGRRVVTIHDTTMLDYDLAPSGLLGRAKYQIKHLALAQAFKSAVTANAILVPSLATKESLLKHFGPGLAERIEVTPEAAGNDPVKSVDDRTGARLLYVGNFYPYKNLQIIIEALPQIAESIPEVSLDVIGRTPRFEDSIKRLAKQLGVVDHINFRGQVSDSERDQAYQAATILVFPSKSEGFGLPPLEAMAQGLPVVAARATCLPEVLGEAARYFDPDSPADLATTVITLLQRPERLSKLQRLGLERVAQFSWSRMAQQTLAVYNRVTRA